MLDENSSRIAQFTVAIILYILAYWYSLKFAVALNDCHTDACNKLRRAHESCLCHVRANLSPLRGDQYYIGAMDAKKREELNGCAMTFWSASHFYLYLLLGFFAPALFWETFIAGVGFEIYEKYAFDCHDVLDVMYNSAGFLLGRAANRLVTRAGRHND